MVPERLRRVVPVAMGLALFAVALEILSVELRAVSWHELTATIMATPRERLGLAIGLTALNYLALTGYDQLAFAYIRKPLPRVHIAVASFLAYTISNTIGFAMLSGASVRYRFYTRWGISAEDLSRIVVSYSTTFWLGLFALGGLSLAMSPLPGLRDLPADAIQRPVGWLLLMVPPAYLALTILRRRPLRLRSFELPMPPVSIAIAQVLISALDWTLAGAVLYALLPPSPLTFLEFLGMFLAAILIGMASHVPGGVGVFEGLIVLFLAPFLSSAQLLPALVVFRVVYYLLPFSIGLIGLVADEVRQQRAHVARAGAVLGRFTEQLTPAMLAAATFAAGVVLLFSSATPAAAGRLALLDRVLPLAVIETSHFLGSVLGAALLILSQALARRLNAAYYLTAIVMVTGMITSLLKGFDFEEATLLLLLLIVLWRARPAFDRQAAFFETSFSLRWIAALIGALGASVWLGLFAFKHVTYSNELWWHFELYGEASRFLRATVGAARRCAAPGLCSADRYCASPRTASVRARSG